MAQRAALAQTITDLTPQPQRLLTGVGGALEPAHQQQLVGKPVIKPGQHIRISVGGKPQGALELCGRLPV